MSVEQLDSVVRSQWLLPYSFEFDFLMHVLLCVCVRDLFSLVEDSHRWLVIESNEMEWMEYLIQDSVRRSIYLR